jgi:hypothetical protein
MCGFAWEWCNLIFLHVLQKDFKLFFSLLLLLLLLLLLIIIINYYFTCFEFNTPYERVRIPINSIFFG